MRTVRQNQTKLLDVAALLTPEHWNLDEEQAQAFNDDGNCVVIAVPGSGKTRLSIAKAAKYVLRFWPDSVMMVTFSRPAADEMRTRLASAIGSELAGSVKIGTYHGLSHEILRRHYKRLDKKYAVIQDGQAKGMILRARDSIAKNISNEDALVGVARIKATVRTDVEVFSRSDPISLIYRAYQSLLADLNGKDFADLIRECNQLFASGELKPHKAKYVLADEDQDKDRMQYDWLLAHQRGGSTITAVGDDDQSIYGFRNAMGHLALRGLAQDVKASVYFLRTNYRCGRNIVLLADQVISENVGRIEKEFLVGSSFEGEISVTSYRDAASEAEGVIKQFEELIDDPSFKPVDNQFAAMHRTNFGLDYLDMAAVGCKYRVVREGGTTFTDRPHVSQALSILRFALDPNDRLNWHNAVSLSGMSSEGIHQFESYIRKLPSRNSMIDAIYAKEWLDKLGKQDKTLFDAFRGVAVRWIEDAEALKDCTAADEDCGAKVQRACSRIAELTSNRYFRQDIHFLGRVIGSRLRGPLGARLALVGRKSAGPEGDEQAETPVLRLMTLHASKGLQFDGVWLTGLNEGALPLDNSDIEEERRLFYVGITRTILRLYISYVKSGDTAPSRFLNSILKSAAAA